MKEFYVAETNGKCAIGYCGNTCLRIGDLFTKARTYKVRVIYDDFIKPPELIIERDIELIIKSIRSYGEERGITEPGLSCILVLEGESRPAKGEILCS